MAKPSWIIIKTTSGTGNATVEIQALPYSGRTDREGIITGTSEGKATDTTSVTQKGATEVITVTKKTYQAANSGQVVSIEGTSNSSQLKIVSKQRIIQGLTYELFVKGVKDDSWNGNSDTTVDGDPGAGETYAFTLKVNVPENKSVESLTDTFEIKNGNENVTSGAITLTQAASVKNYAIPVISAFTYPDVIPASGGQAVPNLTYSQTWGWNSSNTNGGTLSGTHHSPVEGTTFKFEGGPVASTGLMTVPSKGTTESGITIVANVTAQVTLNGKTSAATASTPIKQAANTAAYQDVKFVREPSITKKISAAGGTISYADIIWSGEGIIVNQIVSYTSGSKITITDQAGSENPAISKVILSYSDEVTAESKGIFESAESQVGKITITATGAGTKSATKEVIVKQEANAITSYGEITIGQATPVSINASGQKYTINPGLKQTVTYTSGATRTEASGSKPVVISASYAVTTEKDGFSLNDLTGEVTVTKNPTVNPRNGFVVTITAEGEGKKTATKAITFNQQGAASTLILTPDTMTFEAAGGKQQLTITSTDTWKLS